MKTCLAAALGGCLAVTALSSFASSVHAQLAHRYRAADYSIGTGGAVWADSAGTNNLINPGDNRTYPLLSLASTPTGQPSVRFERTNGFAGDGGRFLAFSTPLGEAQLTSAPDMAVFAVLRGDARPEFQQIVSGNDVGDFQLRLNGDIGVPGFQGTVTAGGRNLFDVGTSSGSVQGNDFVVLAFVYNAAGASPNWSFYLNGVLSGSGTSGGAFTPADLVGTGGGLSDSLMGNLAELRFYTSSAVDVASITSELRTTYVPEPGTLAVIGIAALSLARRPRRA
jgi:hypothetical protein